jgi:hypothetical protein
MITERSKLDQRWQSRTVVPWDQPGLSDKGSAYWLREVTNTTPDPSYAGAHAALSAAASSVPNSILHHDHFDFIVTSEVLPGTTRSFRSFSRAAEEATLSRIFAGVHFRFDLTTGERLGHNVAGFVVDNLLTPVH